MRAIVLLAAAVVCQGADLSGIWTGLIPGRAGRLDEVTFKFAQRGTKLEGKLYGDYRSSPIVEGTVTGAEVEFVVVAEEQAGNQINEVRMRFTGRLEGGALELTRERGPATNAGNAGGVQSRDGATLTFCLKRLL